MFTYKSVQQLWKKLSLFKNKNYIIEIHLTFILKKIISTDWLGKSEIFRNRLTPSFKLHSGEVCLCVVYLRRAGQCEQQVKCSLSEVEVVFGSQAELNSAEHRGEDWNPPHH